jgi:thymidylate synthase
VTKTVYPRFQDAYLKQLQDVLHHPEFHNAPRGFPSREKLGVCFRVRDPVQRHVLLPARRANLVFNFAEALWYLSGSDELAFIEYYAPNIAKYSQDGRTLRGTAYGPKIFDHPETGPSQWECALRTLRDDHDTKRAVLQIYQPQELLLRDNIDVSCTLALQFMIRGGRLCGVGFMRANDVYRGMVSDVFSFTFLLEMMACELGLPVGTYDHQVGSLHLYESDARRARQVLAQAGGEGRTSDTFPSLPAGNNWPYVREVLTWEGVLRTNSGRLSPTTLTALDLPDYWKHVLALFEFYRQIQHERRLDHSVIEGVPRLYQRALSERWPQLFQSISASG